jgi:transcriptional regulator with XRE-family HTH domain
MSSDICVRFGRKLRQLRHEKKMSQITLAEKVGIERTYLSLLENGKKEACLRVIEMLAMGLGVPLKRVFWDL